MHAHLASLLLLLCSAPAADTVVVCPEAFRPALADWVEHRTTQGHDVSIVSNLGSANDVRERIRLHARDGALKYVLLIGDATNQHEAGNTRAHGVPVHWADAEVNVRFGSEPHIATDNWYADLDDDRLPDVAIGRITADTVDELQTILRKILAYERAVDTGLWRRRINLVAGLGGFGKLADAALETTARRLISTGIPAGYATTMTHASWHSPYCPDPREFCDATVSRLNEGSLFWIYMGHGLPWALDRVHVPGGSYAIFQRDDVARLNNRRAPPIAVLLACYTAAFDAASDCLAEQMLASPGGPVAVIGGTRVTMPYGMSVLGTEMLDECFVRRRATLGEVLLHAKRSSVLSPRDDARSRTLDLLAKAIHPAADDLAAERAEHVLLFHLLGDPLLRLRHPEQVQLSVAEVVQPGGVLDVSGIAPVAGDCTVELTVARDRFTFRPPSRREYDDSDGALAEYGDVYRRANDPRLAAVQVPVDAAPFRVRLKVPDDARGRCQIRVFVQGADEFAIGAVGVRIAR